MNNHSSIWKNITMIIFFVFFVIIILILKFNICIFFELIGMRSLIKIKWLFFSYERIGTFFYRNKRKLIIKNKNINERVNYKIKNRKKKFLTKKRDTHILYNLLKSIKFEELYIEEKIGLLKPDVTALAIPFISIISMFPIKFLNINYDKFHYDINPYYSELKFNLTVETKISFRLIDIISCIIKEKMHKLFL